MTYNWGTGTQTHPQILKSTIFSTFKICQDNFETKLMEMSENSSAWDPFHEKDSTTYNAYRAMTHKLHSPEAYDGTKHE